MLRLYSKSVRTTVLYLFTIQLLLYSAAFSDSHNSTNTPSGAEFLQNVIGNLQRPKHKIRVAHERIDVEEYIPNDVPYNAHGDEFKILSKHPYNYNVQNSQANRPSPGDVNKNQAESGLSQMIPSFFKNELAELQNKVVSQGTLQFSPLPSNSQTQNLVDSLSGDSSRPPDGTVSGYNYYFYPLDNNAVQQLQNGGGANGQSFAQGQNPQNPMAFGQNRPPPPQDLDTMNSEQGQVTKPKVEPLFVAMAGFVGVAVVFLSAMMFIPRLPIPALSSKSVLKRAPEELATLTKLVTESIDGKDCSERIACEVGRAMRSMQVGTKPIRMMEIILPPSVAKQLAQIRRSATKKEQCHFIMCKKTEGTLKLVAKLKKTNNKTLNDVKEIFNMH